MPFIMESQLFWLSSPTACQQEDAPAPQRGRYHTELRFVQLPDPARRRVHAGARRRRDRPADWPCTVELCHPRGLVQRQPRVDLRPAANDLGRGALGHRLQHQRPAHGPGRSACPCRWTGEGPRQDPGRLSVGTRRHQDVHRLPPVEDGRQQCHHGPTPDAGHKLRELHWPILLGGGGRTWPGRCGGHRAR